MDQIILNQLTELQEAIATIAKNMVTKDDLRSELKKYATKNDLKQFATKDDLKSFATKDDLKDFVTKKYLKEHLDIAFKHQREAISEDFGRVISDLFTEENKKKADRVDLIQLERRVDRIEQKIVI